MSAVRTCVGCRGRDHQSVLLRVAAADDHGARRVVVDLRLRLPGRGAWLHPRPECLHLAVRRRAFARALKVQEGLQVDEVAVLAAIRSSSHQSGDPEPQNAPVRDGSWSEADEPRMSTQQ